MSAITVTPNFQGTRGLPKWLAPTILAVAGIVSFAINTALAGSSEETTEINLLSVALLAAIVFALSFYLVSRLKNTES
jgi:uncharacterized membrane protein